MSGKEIMENSKLTKNSTEASTGSVLQKKVFLEILQNSQENTCVRVSFFHEVAGLWTRRVKKPNKMYS